MIFFAGVCHHQDIEESSYFDHTKYMHNFFCPDIYPRVPWKRATFKKELMYYRFLIQRCIYVLS